MREESRGIAGATADTSGFAAVNGTTLYYEVRGRGRPVVLLQGGQLDLSMWDDQFEEFAREFRVIRYDARGFGRSGPRSGPFAAHDDLFALLEYLGADRVSLVGLSYGGRVALDFALTHPDLVEALVLVGPGLSGYQWRDPREAWVDSLTRAVNAGDTARGVLFWLKSGYMSPAMRDPVLAGRLRELVRRNASVWLQPDSESVMTPPAIGRLGEVRAPVLLVLGERDVPDIHRIIDTLGRGLRDARTVVVKDVGHMVNLERPAEFNRIVLGFLQRR